MQVKITELCSTSDCDDIVYDQETARIKGKLNYSQLKTAVKLQNDQMMRNRNFRARSDVCGAGISYQESERKRTR